MSRFKPGVYPHAEGKGEEKMGPLGRVILIALGAVLAVALIVVVGLAAMFVPVTSSSSGSPALPAVQVQAAPLLQESASPRTGITVTGEGVVRVQPDAANLTLGVEVTADTAGAALQQAADQMTAVVNQLRSLGIAEQDIQTSQFNLFPIYEERTVRVEPGTPMPPIPPDAEPVLVGYRVSNLVTVTIREIARAGEVLDSVVASGATRVHGIGFTVSNPADAAERARVEAMNNARRTAEQLANLAGVGIGPVVAIQEISSPSPMPVDIERAAPMAQPAQTPISPGSQEIRTIVQVTYSIQ